jgi:hypothetical protein
VKLKKTIISGEQVLPNAATPFKRAGAKMTEEQLI